LSAFAVYLVLCFSSALFFSAITTVNLLYQVEVVGLSPLQMVLVGTALELTIFLCEIPTGVLADSKSRRLSIIIGTALAGLGFIVEGGFPLFAAVVAGQVIWGLGHSFSSGATQAWMVDELGEQQSRQAFVRGAQLEQLGGFLGIALGVGLGLINIQVAVVGGGLGLLVLAVFLALYMPERGFRPTPSAQRQTWAAMGQTLGQARALLRRNTILWPMLAVELFYGLHSEGFDRLWVPHVLKLGLPAYLSPVLWFGLIHATARAAGLVVTEIAQRNLKKRDLHLVRILQFFTTGMVLGIGGLALSGMWWQALVLYVAVGAFRSALQPFHSIWFNERIDDSQVRATLFSIASQVDALGQVGGGPIAGAVAHTVSLRAALLCSACLLGPVFPLYEKTRQKLSNEKGKS